MNYYKVLYAGKLVYEAIYRIHDNRLTGTISRYIYSETKIDEVKEKNQIASFYITDTAAIHISYEYEYAPSPLYLLCFDYLKRGLINLANESKVIERNEETDYVMDVWNRFDYSDRITYEVAPFTNLDNLSYFIQEAMLVENDPIILLETLNKLEEVQPTTEIERSAQAILSNFRAILEDENANDYKKTVLIATSISENVQIFEDYERLKKEGE